MVSLEKRGDPRGKGMKKIIIVVAESALVELDEALDQVSWYWRRTEEAYGGGSRK